MDQIPENSTPNASRSKLPMSKIVTIVVVVAAVSAAGYGINAWIQQRMASGIVKQIAGVDIQSAGKNVVAGAIQGAAELGEKAEEAVSNGSGSTASPKEGYADAEEVAIIGDTPAVLKDVIRPAVDSAFGSVKMTEFNNIGGTQSEGAFTASFSVARAVSADDFTSISNAIKAQGYTLVTSTASKGTGKVMLQKEKIVMTFSFDQKNPQTVSLFCIQGK